MHVREGHIEHICMVVGVELGKNGAEVHRRIMINAGDAMLNFLDLEFFCRISAFFHATNMKNHQKQIGQLWDAVTSSKP